MKIPPLALTLCWSLLLLMPLPRCYALDLPALIREVETRYQGASSHALVTMEIRTAHWQRSLQLEIWSQGRDRFLARIKADQRAGRGNPEGGSGGLELPAQG